MPANKEFSFCIRVNGEPIREYHHGDDVFVECNLATDVSYKKNQVMTVRGEKETQEWPVTPYEIEVKAMPTAEVQRYYRILVDGVKVKGISLHPGETKLVQGFRDGKAIREFLFSLPRFSADITDKLEGERCAAVGYVEVQCWNAPQKQRKQEIRHKYLKFKQASKNDTQNVTHGKYTMATSCAGRRVGQRSVLRNVDCWKRTTQRSCLRLQYHMAHTLQGMGIKLRGPGHGSVMKKCLDCGCKIKSPTGCAHVKDETLPTENDSEPLASSSQSSVFIQNCPQGITNSGASSSDSGFVDLTGEPDEDCEMSIMVSDDSCPSFAARQGEETVEGYSRSPPGSPDSMEMVPTEFARVNSLSPPKPQNSALEILDSVAGSSNRSSPKKGNLDYVAVASNQSSPEHAEIEQFTPDPQSSSLRNVDSVADSLNHSSPEPARIEKETPDPQSIILENLDSVADSSIQHSSPENTEAPLKPNSSAFEKLNSVATASNQSSPEKNENFDSVAGFSIRLSPEKENFDSVAGFPIRLSPEKENFDSVAGFPIRLSPEKENFDSVSVTSINH